MDFIINNRVFTRIIFKYNIIGRLILKTFAKNEEAITLLKEIPHRTSFSYVLTDKSGETYVVEATPRKVIARKSNVSTNHFEVLTEENRYRTAESMERQRSEERRVGKEWISRC